MDTQTDSNDQELAQFSTEPSLLQVTELSYAQLKAMADIAYVQAKSMGVPIAFSFVDVHGQLRFFFSMDEVLLVSPNLCQKKAYTAVAMKHATRDLAATQSLLESHVGGLQLDDNFCVMGGGVPCWHQHQFLGALGVSGGTEAEDHQIAEATLQHFNEQYFSLASESAD